MMKQNAVPSNQILKELHSLHLKKFRDAKKQFLVEGEKFVSEIPSSYEIIRYFFSKKFYENFQKHSIIRENVPLYILDDPVFVKSSGTKTPQGIIAVVTKKEYNPLGLTFGCHDFFILCENLQDPGNVGTIIRTAHAVGANGVFLSPGCVDLYNPKTIRSTASSLFHLPVFTGRPLDETVSLLRQNAFSVFAAHPGAGHDVFACDFTKKTALVIGNEASGVSGAIHKLCNAAVKIPMPGGADSINASVAAGVLMYEMLRQKQQSSYETVKYTNERWFS